MNEWMMFLCGEKKLIGERKSCFSFTAGEEK
jgi:hypothetical protein